MTSKERYYKNRQNSEWLEKEKLRDRTRKKGGKQYKKKSINTQRHWKKYPEKYKARMAVRHVPREVGHHLHHWSYKEEHRKDCIELSMEDHNKAHRFLEYDVEDFLYKTKTGELLDTKEKHLVYILDVIKNEL